MKNQCCIKRNYKNREIFGTDYKKRLISKQKIFIRKLYIVKKSYMIEGDKNYYTLKNKEIKKFQRKGLRKI